MNRVERLTSDYQILEREANDYKELQDKVSFQKIHQLSEENTKYKQELHEAERIKIENNKKINLNREEIVFLEQVMSIYN